MPDGDEWDDLAANVAGQQVGREANRRRTAEGAGADRSWRIGAEGEHRMGEVLDTLGRVSWLDRLRGRQPQWHVLHSVPVGTGKSDIDHLVIGPPGVLTINTKHHPTRHIAIDGDILIIGGQPTKHVAKAQAEAQRATRLLRAALTKASEPELAATLTVRPVLALVGARLVDKGRPGGVIVATLDNLLMCLHNLPTSLNPAEVDRLFNIARRSTTWTQAVPTQVSLPTEELQARTVNKQH